MVSKQSSFRAWPVLFIICIITSFAEAHQEYCHKQDHIPLHLCLAIDTHHNVTSNATDLLITFGHQIVSERTWTAVGLGSSMFGALVFIGFVKSNGDPAVEFRESKGHFEPQPSLSLPNSAVLSLAINGSAWFESTFYIYGSDVWLGDENQDLSNQPLIWATGSRGQGDGASLSMHEDRGFFKLDLDPHSNQNTTTNPVQPPPTDLDKEHGKKSPRAAAFYLHGLSLVVGVMILYPAGAALLRFSTSRPFRLHLYVQKSASVLCLIGVVAAAFAVRAEPQSYFHEPHVLVGLLILSCVLLQNALGWYHHRAYVRGAAIPSVTLMHVILGRFIIVAGSVNAVLGLVLANAVSTTLAIASILCAINILLVLAIAYKNYRKTRKEKQEADIPLLEETDRL